MADPVLPPSAQALIERISHEPACPCQVCAVISDLVALLSAQAADVQMWRDAYYGSLPAIDPRPLTEADIRRTHELVAEGKLPCEAPAAAQEAETAKLNEQECHRGDIGPDCACENCQLLRALTNRIMTLEAAQEARDRLITNAANDLLREERDRLLAVIAHLEPREQQVFEAGWLAVKRLKLWYSYHDGPQPPITVADAYAAYRSSPRPILKGTDGNEEPAR